MTTRDRLSTAHKDLAKMQATREDLSKRLADERSKGAATLAAVDLAELLPAATKRAKAMAEADGLELAIEETERRIAEQETTIKAIEDELRSEELAAAQEELRALAMRLLPKIGALKADMEAFRTSWPEHIDQMRSNYANWMYGKAKDVRDALVRFAETAERMDL